MEGASPAGVRNRHVGALLEQESDDFNRTAGSSCLEEGIAAADIENPAYAVWRSLFLIGEHRNNDGWERRPGHIEEQLRKNGEGFTDTRTDLASSRSSLSEGARRDPPGPCAIMITVLESGREN